MKPKSWKEQVGPMRAGYGIPRQLRAICRKLDIPVKRIIELGVYRGDNARKLRGAFPDADLHLVDAWKHLWDSGPMMRANPTQAHWDRMLAKIRADFKGDSRVSIHRMLIENAPAKFADESADIVYIDGDHRYESVKRDILDWLPKVRPGGLLAGHDYKNHGGGKGVVKAVNELFSPDEFAVYRYRLWVYRKPKVEA